MSPSLASVLAEHQIALPEAQQRRVEEYCGLLWEWNSRLNLTRHTDYRTFVSRDLVDSLELSRALEPNESVLDVGSGGGVPGMLLAILRPDLRITLSESMQKKAHALADMRSRLELPLEVKALRAEKILEEASFDVLTARAVGSLARVLRWFRPHWQAIGRFVLIKGPRWVEERGEARHLGLLRALELRKHHAYSMPGTASESVILVIRKP